MSSESSDIGAFQLARLFTFVPPNVTRALGALPVPLLSTQLAAVCAEGLSGPVVEVTWPGTSALLGCLRAVRRVGGALAIVIPDAFTLDDPSARLRIVRALLALAEEARFDRPLFLVRRLRGLSARTPADAEQLLLAISAEVEAGVTSIALRPAELGVDLAELAALLAPFFEVGVSFELEFEPRDGASVLLADLADLAGVRFAAVRGASPEDELAGAVLVVDPLEEYVPENVACRVSLDAFVGKGIARALPAAAREELLRAVRREGASAALVLSLDTLAELDDDERARVETFVYAEVSDALPAVSADGVGDELAAVLAGASDAVRNDV